VKRYHEQFQWPLAAAILLLLAEMFLPEREAGKESFEQRPPSPRPSPQGEGETLTAFGRGGCNGFFHAIVFRQEYIGFACRRAARLQGGQLYECTDGIRTAGGSEHE